MILRCRASFDVRFPFPGEDASEFAREMEWRAGLTYHDFPDRYLKAVEYQRVECGSHAAALPLSGAMLRAWNARAVYRF